MNPAWRDLAGDFGFEPLIGKKEDPDQARDDGGGGEADFPSFVIPLRLAEQSPGMAARPCPIAQSPKG